MIPLADGDIYFPNILPPVLPTESPIQSKKRTTMRINLCALGQIFYFHLGSNN